MNTNIYYVGFPVVSLLLLMTITFGGRSLSSPIFIIAIFIVIIGSYVSIKSYALDVLSQIYLSLLTLVNVVLLGYGTVDGFGSFGFGMLAGFWIVYIFLPSYVLWFICNTYAHTVIGNNSDKASSSKKWTNDAYLELYDNQAANICVDSKKNSKAPNKAL